MKDAFNHKIIILQIILAGGKKVDFVAPVKIAGETYIVRSRVLD